MMKLMIAIPCMDFVHVEFLRSLTDLIARLHEDGIQYAVRIHSGTLVYHARDALARAAMNGDFTHVLWLDSDMVFTPTIVDDLLFCGAPMVSGVYHARRKPYVSCIFSDVENANRYKYGEYPGEPFEIAGCGFGAVLMKIEVIEQVWVKFGQLFLPTARLGEDLAFCDRVKTVGYKIFCDPSVMCGHVGHITIYPQDEEQSWKEIKSLKEVAQCLKQ